MLPSPVGAEKVAPPVAVEFVMLVYVADTVPDAFDKVAGVEPVASKYSRDDDVPAKVIPFRTVVVVPLSKYKAPGLANVDFAVNA